MRTITYDHRREERESWGPGPWVDEPDKMQWQDETTGLPCLVVRNHMGALCGYVGVHEGHPWFGISYGASVPDDDWEPVIDVEVHGGLTFSAFCQPGQQDESICHLVEPGEDDHTFWLGFDCGHSSDVIPGYEKKLREAGIPPIEESFPWAVSYKTVDYARNEVTSLAAQVKAADQQ